MLQVTVKLEVLGPVHHVRSVAVVKPVLNHFIDNDSVQIDDVMHERCVHRALHIHCVSKNA